MSGFSAVGYFLITLLFGITISILWLRIALRYYRMSVLHPFAQLVYALTNPILGPLDNLVQQNLKTRWKYDGVAFGVLILVEFLKITCLSLLVFHALLPPLFMLLYVAADLIMQPCDLLFYAILIRVIMLFANPHWQHPIEDFLRTVTNPLLSVGRRIIPPIAGFDFSPMVVMILLKIITLFINYSLPLRLL